MVSDADISRKLEASRGDMPFEAALAGWKVEVGLDATGDRAVWVWVIIHDDLVDQVWPHAIRDDLRDRVREAVRQVAGDDVLVYVRFRLESEQRGLVGEDWAG